MRASIKLAVIAFALVGSVGVATAQYAPPPPPGYPPIPPAPVNDYPPPPTQPYTSQPMPPPVGGPQAAAAGPYGQGPAVQRDASDGPYGGQRYQQQEDAGGAFPPQPMPVLGGGPLQRPPADIADGAVQADVTGAVPAPAAVVPDRSSVIAALPPEDQPEQGPPQQLPPQFRRQVVDYMTKEPAGTIIIDTPNTYLYLVLGNGKAMRYGIGVGREGFTWSGTERVARMSEWPDWHPPKEMIERQPYLPRFMAGGESNPLGARALYLGNTLYRIHGTNQPSTIGTFVSSGCIRLTNEDVSDLYSRVSVGTRVVVLPGALPAASASVQGPVTR